MTKVQKVVYQRRRKCPGCNWPTQSLFLLVGDKEDLGLCADCFMDALVDEKMDLVDPRPERVAFLLKWIENRSLTVSDANDARHALDTILGEVRV